MIDGPSREELNQFHETIAIAQEGRQADETPCVEVPRKVIDYYNRHAPKGFDMAGYFVYQGVKVYETGTTEAKQKLETVSLEQRLHGGK